MKVIFLDFDGVLNSYASFMYESAKADRDTRIKTRASDTLCHICTSNLQHLLDSISHLKIVISSTWRVLHPMSYLKRKLKSYGVDASLVVGQTPKLDSGHRGHEISKYLSEHPEITEYVILDDNDDMTVHMGRLVQIDPYVGLTLRDTAKVKKLFNS